MKIKYIYWDDDTGYGIAAKQLIKALSVEGIQVLPVGLKQNRRHPAEYKIQDNTLKTMDYNIVFIHTSPYYLSRYIEEGKINIAYCTWETSLLPQPWVDEINTCDVIFVPSRFNKSCFEHSGVIKPVYILPHISQFHGKEGTTGSPETIKKVFTFYSIGMWTNRKNNLSLMNAFTKAFPNNERVRLIIKTSNKDYTRAVFDLFKRIGYTYYRNVNRVNKIKKVLKIDSRIEIITEAWSADQIAQLHFSGDCYISLCKSEGWGLGVYEAAWFGKPVIITGYGGHLDFLPDSFATLLPFELVKIKDPVWTDYNQEGQEWAEVNINAAIQSMKEVFSNQAKYAKQGKHLMQYVSNHFSSKQIVETFKNHVQPKGENQ